MTRDHRIYIKDRTAFSSSFPLSKVNTLHKSSNCVKLAVQKNSGPARYPQPTRAKLSGPGPTSLPKHRLPFCVNYKFFAGVALTCKIKNTTFVDYFDLFGNICYSSSWCNYHWWGNIVMWNPLTVISAW